MRDVLENALPLRATCSTAHQVDIALPSSLMTDSGTLVRYNREAVMGIWMVCDQKAQRIQKNHSLLPLDKRSVEMGKFSCREFGEELKV